MSGKAPRRRSRAPRSLHDIEFGEQIGAGLFGRVFKARNRINGEVLAVKEVSGRTVKSKLDFLKEANVLRNVRHPHLLRLRAVLVQELLSSDASTLSRSDSRSASASSSAAASAFARLRSFAGGAAKRTDSTASSCASEHDLDPDAGDSQSTATGASAPISGYKCYLVTEFCEAGSLGNILSDRSQNLPWKTRVRWAYEAALGLQHLHRSSVIHRDLKRENCLLRRAEDVTPDADLSHLTLVLADFGLARYCKPPKNADGTKLTERELQQQRRAALLDPEAARRAQNQMTVVGTPWLMAPELMSAKSASRGYTVAAEMFTFGVLLLEIMTRRRARDIPRVSATLAIDMDTVERMTFDPRTGDSDDADLRDHVDEVAEIVAERERERDGSDGGGGGNRSSVRRRESLAYTCPPGLLDLAAECVALEPKKRPSVDQVVERLETLLLSL